MCSAKTFPTNPKNATIVLTRPEKSALDFSRSLRAAPNFPENFPIILAPLRQLHAGSLAPRMPEPDEVLIISSANAVDFVPFSLSGVRVLVIGSQTAEKAMAKGAEVVQVFVSSSWMIAELAKTAPTKFYVLSGRPTSFNAKSLEGFGHQVTDHILYRATDLCWSGEVLNDLISYDCLIVPVFSRDSWPVLLRELSILKADYKIEILPISNVLRDTINQDLPEKNLINAICCQAPKEPTRAGMISMLTKLTNQEI